MKQYMQPILKAIGYYDVKTKWRWHQYISALQKADAERKAEAIAWIKVINHRLLPQVKKSGNVTVSLTSHSKRVSDFAPFAIYSIFHQTVLPNRIVLNINQDKWNEDNLPELIKKLQVAGLEVNFCEDVGPHTKLLPAMQRYPEDVIITVDDDIYYDETLLFDLLTEYHLHAPNCVICRDALVVGVRGGEVLPYAQWNEANPSDELPILPLGVSGVLYAPHIFSKEVFNKDVFLSLCSHADDVWFMVQEQLDEISVYIVKESHHRAIQSVDHKNEYVAEGSSALHFQNMELGGNDKQLAELIKYYNVCFK